jgi:ankyrin repeat protein
MAAAQGWKDGKEQYEPTDLLALLQQGMKSCSSTGFTSTAVAALPSPSAQIASSPPTATTAPVARPSSSFSREGFYKAASNGDIPTLKQYVDGGFAVDTPGPDMPWLNQKGNPVIAAAAAAKKCAAVDYLLSVGAKPDFKGTKYGWTPIAHAAQAGATDCVRSLLAAGARPDVALERGGDTPLIMAAYQGHLDVVKLLVEHGASLSIKNKDGDTAYRAAVMGGSNATAQYLKSKSGK